MIPATPASHGTGDDATELVREALAKACSSGNLASRIGVPVRTVEDWIAGRSFPWHEKRVALLRFLKEGAHLERRRRVPVDRKTRLRVRRRQREREDLAVQHGMNAAMVAPLAIAALFRRLSYRRRMP